MTRLKIIFCMVAIMLSYTNAEDVPPNTFTIADMSENPSVLVLIESKDSTSEKLQYIGVNMTLAIDNSHSLLFKTCKDYDTSKFSTYKVNPEENDTPGDQYNLTYNVLSVSGYTAQANVAFNEKSMYWSTDSLTVVNSCQSSRNFKGAQGMIGLGYKGEAANKFKDTKVFAYYMAKSKVFSGNLVFNPSNSDIEKRSLLRSLKANEDWHVTGDTKLNFGKKSSSMDKLDVTFDMRMHFYLFPWRFFSIIRNELWSKGLSDINPIFHGDWTTLPNITLKVGEQEIIITPDQYLLLPGNVPKKNYANQKVSFMVIQNIRDDNIMLGWRYLYDHYTVFDMNDGHIKFYTADQPIEDEKRERQRQTRELEEEKKRKEEEKRKQEEREKAEKEKRETEESRKRMLWWTIGIVAFLIVVGVIGFGVWKKGQAGNRGNNVDNQPILYNQN